MQATIEATQVLAQRLAADLKRDDVLLLGGEVGAGKTTFARGLIHTLCSQVSEVTSPTFSLVQPYDVVLADGTAAELWHCDLYRLESAAQLAELGILDPHPARVLVIEWPELVRAALGAEALAIDFSLPDNAAEATYRNVTLAGGERWQAFLKQRQQERQRA